MSENESFDSFITNLSEIVNSFHALGDPIPNLKVCRKILRSLPERFRAKVVAIEERPEVDEMPFEELVGKLQTFELNHLSSKTPSKSSKGTALRLSQIGPLDSLDEDSDLSPEEIAFFAKSQKKFMKFRQARALSKSNNEESKEFRNVQCHE